MDDGRANAERSTCEVRHWPVFAPGVFKQSGEYFSPADVHKIGRNFTQYSVGDDPPLRPLIKLGHHRSQRYAQSLGFPSLGQVIAAHTDPTTNAFIIDRAVGIPRIIGSAINSGRLVSGSLELPPKGVWRPPNDPAAKIDGDILSGVALLGEEMPGVPGYPRPKAVFADGTPVPPLTDAEEIWWMEHMAPVLAGLNEPDDDRGAGNEDEQDYASRMLCFSALTFSAEMDPMQEKLLALGLTPEQIEGVMAVMATPEPAVADVAPVVAEEMPPPAGEVFSGSDEIRGKNQDGQKRAMFAKDPDGAPHDTYSACDGKDKPMTEDYASKFAAMETRLAAMEAAESAKKDKEKATEMAAFSAMADQVIERSRRKAGPERLKASKEMILKELGAGVFASAADQKAAFADWAKGWDGMPESPVFQQSAQTAPADGSSLKALAASNPQLTGMLHSENLRRAFPESSRKIAEKFGVQLA